ncbi:MAG: TraB/GumN family protein [Steroidobacteraceae bacterium]
MRTSGIRGAVLCAAVLAGCMGAGQVVAQAAPSAAAQPAPAADNQPVQEVDVTGERPGPSLWRVSKGDHVAWLLGTLDPLPKKMIWRSREVESVISQAQEVLASRPSVSADVGPITIIRLYLQYRRTRKLPRKSSLRDSLPPPLYARFSAVKLRFDPHDREIEELQPLFAALRLYDRALSASQLTSRDDIQAEVFRLARRHHVTIERLSLKLADPRGILTEVGEIPRSAEIDCLGATVGRLETDLGAMQARARAWALGDVDELRALPYPKQREVCTTTVANSPQIRVAMAQAASEWETALESSIAAHRTTLAMKPIYELIGPGGTLATLRAKGYTVEGP